MKRGYHMGVTIREKIKGSGKWYVFVTTNGRRASKLVGKKKTALIVAEKIKAKLALGMDAWGGKKLAPKFSEYAKKFITGYVKNNLKPSTYRSYESIIRIHLLPAYRSHTIDAITRESIKDLLIDKAKKLSGNRVKRIQSCISSLMAMAIEDGHIKTNPASGLQKYIGSCRPVDIPDPYTAFELNIYLNTCLACFPQYYPFFLLLARTGLRIGEAIALKWGDIDYLGKFITVRRSITDGIENTPKSGKYRRVPLSAQLIASLKELRTTRKNQALKKGWGKVPNWVFISSSRTPYNPANITQRIHNKITEKSGLRRIRLHDFRHTYATLRLANGDYPQNVSKAMGHSSINITIGTYMMYLPESDIDAVDKLDTLGTTQPLAVKEK